MSKHEGWLIWREKFVTWKHQTFKSTKDLTLHPHFEVTVMEGKGDKESITFNDIVIKDKQYKNVKELMELPKDVREVILDQAVDAFEFEQLRSKHNGKA